MLFLSKTYRLLIVVHICPGYGGHFAQEDCAVAGSDGRRKPDGHAKNIIQVDASAHYPLTTLEIKGLPVKEVAADVAHLYLWATSAFMGEAHDVDRAWDFQPKMILTCVKFKQYGPEV